MKNINYKAFSAKGAVLTLRCSIKKMNEVAEMSIHLEVEKFFYD